MSDCLRCWMPAKPQVHHGRPENTSQGKGMGGTSEDWPEHDLYDLCDPCHDGLHAKLWTFEKDDAGWVTGTNANGTTFERPLVVDNSSPSPAAWDDAKLGLYWEAAGAALLKDRATIANIYKQRWGWGRGWARRASDAMGGGKDGTGQPISERTVRRCANVWKHWQGDWEKMKQLGSTTVAYAIAGAEDSDRALEIAQEQLASGKRAGEVVALIEGKSAKPVQEPCEEHEWRCRRCGAQQGG